MPPGTNWIITHTGGHVDPFNAKPSDILLDDIAHALGNICRFTGHVQKFYSVAQHSVHVAERVRRHGVMPAMHALFHDAHEAYLNDLSAPVKRNGAMYGYKTACNVLQMVIHEALGLPEPGEQTRDAIKEADLDLMLLEGEQLVGHGTGEWGYGKPTFQRKLISLAPGKSTQFFLNYYYELRRSLEEQAPR